MNDPVDPARVREVCPTTTRRLTSEGALVVDGRERSEVAQATVDVPDIVVMPLSEFGQRVAELPRHRERVMDFQSGPRSLKATCFLMRQGCTRVADMEGGHSADDILGRPELGAG